MQPIKCLSFVLCLGAVLVSNGPAQTAKPPSRSEQLGLERQQALTRFESWAKRYAATPNADSRLVMRVEGLALAKERRAALRELVESDPGRALTMAIPDSVRDQVPAEVANELEVPVSGIGDLLVFCAIPPMGTRTAEAIQRRVRLDGRTYRAFVYGRRLSETTKFGIPLHGVVIDSVLAVHESALSELAPAEAAALTDPVVDLTKAAGPFAGFGPARLARMGRTIYRFSSKQHLRQSEALLEAAEAGFRPEPIQTPQSLLEQGLVAHADQSTTIRPLTVPSRPPNQKRVLVIRTDFSDLPGDPRSPGSFEPLTASAVQTLADTQISPYYQNSSYGKATVAVTVTPQLYRLPQSAVRYATVIFQDQLYQDAESAAAADYNTSAYDVVVVLFTWLGSLPGSQIQFGGLTLIGSSMVWVNGEFDFRVVAHELGHAYGLYHANLWKTNDGDPISDNGSTIEYGDVFDTMGANWGNDRRTDFNPWFKYQLNWITDEEVQTVTTNGTYRVYRFDDAGATGALALKVAKDASRNYWVGCRHNFAENSTMQNGAYVIWGYNWARQSDLLGMGAANYARDAALVIGEALADSTANLTILPVAEGGVAPADYLDVQVTFGPPPTISAQPQAQLALAGQDAQFSIVVTGNPAPGFMWQRQVRGTTTWVTLNEGAGYNGASTATLLLSGAAALMDGDAFRCLLTNSAGGFNCTRPAVLTVERFGVATLAGQPGLPGPTDGIGGLAQFYSPMGIAVDSDGNCFVADTANHVIRKITPAGVVTTWAGLAGKAGSADGNGSNARFNAPTGVAVDTAGNVYVADQNNSTIRRIAPDGSVTTLSGLAQIPGSTDALGTASRFNHPSGIAVDCFGNLYVADTGNHSVRKIDPEGMVTTLAGLNGIPGAIDGTGSSARFDSPVGIAVDTAQNVYVTDQNNSTIRKITPQGQVSTLVGAPGLAGSADGIGNSAQFSFPAGLAVDAGGNLYVADRNNSTIRKVTARGLVSTVAGAAGSDGFTDGACSVARFTYPTSVAVDNQGTIYVADTSADTIRMIRTGSVPGPALQMSVVAGQLILSWPASATGFALETSSALPPGASWIPVTTPVGIFGCNVVVTNSLAAPLAFFRLHKP